MLILMSMYYNFHIYLEDIMPMELILVIWYQNFFSWKNCCIICVMNDLRTQKTAEKKVIIIISSLTTPNKQC